MLKHLACSTFALAIFLTGCSGGGSDPAGNPGVGFTEALQEVADCAGLSLEDADDLLRLFADLVIAVDTNSMIVMDINWTDPSFGAVVDLDGDGQDETISGSVEPPMGGPQISPGFDVGEMATVQWMILGNTITGSGNFELERLANGLARITQDLGTLVENGDCQLNLTNLNLTFDPALPDGSLDASGTIGFTLTTSTDSLTGTVTFTGGNTAQINAMFRGQNVSLSIDLTNFQVTIL